MAGAPIDRIPVYLRAGTILVMGNPVQSTAQAQDNIRIIVNTGADADFTLYEDDGTSYGYEKGEFCRIPIHWDDAARTLTIAEREGSFPGMSPKKNFLVMVNGLDGAGPQPVAYNGSAVSIAVLSGSSPDMSR